MMSLPGQSLASRIACRKLPAPESLALITVVVTGVTVRPYTSLLSVAVLRAWGGGSPQSPAGGLRVGREGRNSAPLSPCPWGPRVPFVGVWRVNVLKRGGNFPACTKIAPPKPAPPPPGPSLFRPSPPP